MTCHVELHQLQTIRFVTLHGASAPPCNRSAYMLSLHCKHNSSLQKIHTLHGASVYVYICNIANISRRPMQHNKSATGTEHGPCSIL